MSEVPASKIIDINRLVLFTDGVDGKRARFQFSVRETYPRLTVFTGAKGKEGIISGPMDMDGLMLFCKYLEDIADGPNNSKMAIELKTMQYENDKPTDNKVLVSTLFCGKDEKGHVWIGLQAEGKPKLKFIFKGTDYMVFKKSDGTSPSDSEMSAIIAKSYVNMVKSVYAYYLYQSSINKITTTPKLAIPGTVGSIDINDDIAF